MDDAYAAASVPMPRASRPTEEPKRRSNVA